MTALGRVVTPRTLCSNQMATALSRQVVVRILVTNEADVQRLICIDVQADDSLLHGLPSLGHHVP